MYQTFCIPYFTGIKTYLLRFLRSISRIKVFEEKWSRTLNSHNLLKCILIGMTFKILAVPLVVTVNITP